MSDHASTGNIASRIGDSPDIDVTSPTLGRLPGFRFLVLARICNFAMLRRHLGRPRADELAGEVADAMGTLLPWARVAAAGRDMVELAFEGDSRDLLDTTLADLVAVSGEPISIDGEAHRLDLLLGAALGRSAQADEIAMVEEAEQALRQADAEHRAVVRDTDAARRSVDRIALAHDLERAVAEDELFLQYQPKVDVRTQRVDSVEALVRWRHPERGLVLPGDFIPLAEETRAILPMTLWTIRRALADQASMTARGHPLRVFVNIAGALLADARFVAEACELVRDAADRIGFEVTETSVIRDPEGAIANLKRFADLGVRIAIDDYGAGLSSLAYLKRLPARELKIDKLFVTQLTSSNRDPLIVRSTIDLAHALEMKVVAEGVETQASAALLSVMGCDMIQGFLISRPIGVEALIASLNEGAYSTTVEDSRAMFSVLAARWKQVRG